MNGFECESDGKKRLNESKSIHVIWLNYDEMSKPQKNVSIVVEWAWEHKQ